MMSNRWRNYSYRYEKLHKSLWNFEIEWCAALKFHKSSTLAADSIHIQLALSDSHSSWIKRAREKWFSSTFQELHINETKKVCLSTPTLFKHWYSTRSPSSQLADFSSNGFWSNFPRRTNKVNVQISVTIHDVTKFGEKECARLWMLNIMIYCCISDIVFKTKKHELFSRQTGSGWNHLIHDHGMNVCVNRILVWRNYCWITYG